MTFAATMTIPGSFPLERSLASAPGTSDAALVLGARRGSDDDFRALVERYQGQVFGLLARMGFAQSMAEDLAQEAFIKAWRALPSFRGESQFNTWLYRIVYRQALQHLRSRDRQLRVADDVQQEWLTGAPSMTGHSQYELRATLDRALGELPGPQRLALALYYFHEQSYLEVAETMELPLNTVKTHIRRGKLRLRELLEGVVTL
ncbi:MAG: RNA polymerase sigma factor [bacterium]